MADMTPARFLALLDGIVTYKSARHQPLLLLWALGRAGWSGHPRLTPYGDNSQTPHRDEVETPLRGLLARFDPEAKPATKQKPQYPYWFLRKELWEIPDRRKFNPPSGRTPPLPELRKTAGGLPEPIWRLVRSDPALVQRAAQRLLDRYFPPSLHADVRLAVGLQVGPSISDRERFRKNVLTAYECHCAVCDFHLRLKDRLIGLEAAHIKSPAAGGPDEVPNGLALCAFHHEALGLGAIGLQPRDRDVILLVSDELTGTSRVLEQQLLAFVGHPLRRPQHPDMTPAPAFVAWHRREVFRGAPRRAARR